MSGPVARRATGVGATPAPRRIAKADEDSASLLETFLTTAERLTEPVKQAVLGALSKIAGAAPDGLWAEAMENGDISPLIAWVLDQLESAELQKELLRVVRESMRRSREWLSMPTIDLDTPNPVAVALMADYPVPLVRSLSQSVREVIADIVADGIGRGWAPTRIARVVEATKGFALTPNQYRAVQNYRDELETGRLGAQRRRALRDGRFALRRELSPEEIDKRVARYGQRYLRYRATAIARTETIRALNTGLWLTTHQAAEQGLLPRDQLVRRWIPAPDNATGGGPCPVCLDVALYNEAGVGFDDPFYVPETGELLMFPPAHPHCRCVVFTRPRIGNETFRLSNAYLPIELRRAS